MITIFTLINSFTCFFLKKLNNFVGFITPVVKKWLSHENLVAASAFLVLYVTFLVFYVSQGKL